MIYIKYLLTGISTKIHSTLFLVILVELVNIPPLQGYILVFFYSVYFNFTLNKLWVFKQKGNIAIYTLVTLLSLLLSTYIFSMLEKNIHYVLASIITSGITYPIHFILNKTYSFTPSKHRTQ